ncbi:PREDICTED: calpain-10 [Bison bison bison]|uniref:Calpain-10 n=1 Tax=Bison bison bison TaxID=43346 RepID=A0A6P3HBV1_BISBB|nr:PREDICTED: calpain-10 [Bison bison bison]
MRAPAKELFRDAAFPASDSSLFSSFSTPLAQFREEITWRRPQEICATPRLFAGSPQEGQVKQGLLGDCWFLCACAALQKSRHLLDQVSACRPRLSLLLSLPELAGRFLLHLLHHLPSPGPAMYAQGLDRERRRGVLTATVPTPAGACVGLVPRRACAWTWWGQGGAEREVIEVGQRQARGDRRAGGPVPGLTPPGRLPRVHGSYEQLWAGQVADALVDLTGGLAERWNLKDVAGSSGQQDGPRGAERRTCRQLLSLKDRCLLSCSVLGPRTGTRELGEFHAFIVSDLRELQDLAGRSVLLLRIQNPWGRRCWQGPWREGGEGWSQVEPAAQAELLSQLQDGEFWVEEDEFLREFDEVTIGFPSTEAGHLQSLHSGKVLCHTQELPGAWVKGQSAGGCRNNSGFPSNPKFWLRVCEPSEVYLGVLRRPRVRAAGCPGRDYQAVGLHLWKVEKRRVNLPRALSAPPVAGTACHAYDREVHLRCELGPGFYLAVPSTFLKDVPGQFLLRVFSTQDVPTEGRLALGPGAAQGRVAGSREKARGSQRHPERLPGLCALLRPPGASAQGLREKGQGTDDSEMPARGGRHSGASAGPQAGGRVPADGGGQDAPSLLLQEPLLSCVPHCYAQEVSRLCHLPAGAYRIVPSTYLPDTEGAFTLTVETRIDRRSIHSQEMLGQPLQEASFMAVMKA